MFRDLKILTFFICFAAFKSGVDTHKHNDLKMNVFKLTSLDKIGDNLSSVEIINVRCEVYSFDLIENHQYQLINSDGSTNYDDLFIKLTLFYSCLNCKFAEWIQNKLLILIESNPTLYQKVFQSKYNELCRTRLEESENLLDEIIKNTKHFVSILFNYLEFYTYSALLDTSLLKSLVSLQIKINYIRTIINDKEKITGELEDTVIQGLLGILNQVQKFKALNCKIPSATVDHVPFYGYSKSYHQYDSYENDVKNLLTNIGPTYLYNPYKYCEVDQMLLNSVINSNNPISNEFDSISIKLSCGKLSIREIQMQVMQTDNLEVIHWYQHIIYNSIIRLICDKLHTYLQYNSHFLYTEIIDGFKILSFMLANSRKLSKEWINIVEFVISKMSQYDHSRIDGIHIFFKNLQHIYWGHSEVIKSDFPTFVLSIDRKRSVLDLEQFLDEIIIMFKDFKCFTRLFELLSFEFLTPRTRNIQKLDSFINEKICVKNSTSSVVSNYLPSISTSSNTLPHPKNDYDIARSVLDDRGCSLLLNLYHNCFETLIILNNMNNEYSSAYNVHKDAEGNMLDLISNLHILNNAYDWLPLKRITSSLHNTWGMLRKWFPENRESSAFLRFFYLVMTELNDLGLEFCRPPKYNYLLFGNIDFDSIGLHKNGRRTFMALPRNPRLTQFSVGDFPSLKEVQKLFIKKKRFIDSYKDYIKIYWKGETKSAGDIYKNIISTVSNPSYTLALFDIYFKFCFAVICYETERFHRSVLNLLKQRSFKRVNNQFRYLDSINKLTMDEFPDYFRDSIYCYNLYFFSIYNNLVNGGSNRDENLFKTATLLVKEMKSLGVFIEAERDVLPVKLYDFVEDGQIQNTILLNTVYPEIFHLRSAFKFILDNTKEMILDYKRLMEYPENF